MKNNRGLMEVRTLFVIVMFVTGSSVSQSEDCSVPEPIAKYPLNGQYTLNEKGGPPPQGKLGNGVSLAEGPDGKANGSYQFDTTNESYIEFPNNASTLGVLHSITMLCWVYVSNSSISRSFLFAYHSGNNSKKYFGMAIENNTLAAYLEGADSPDIQSGILKLKHWHYVGASYDHTSAKANLWVNGTVVGNTSCGTTCIPSIGDSTKRMGAVRVFQKRITFKFRGRIAAMQVYNVSLTKQQIEAVKNVSGREAASSLLPLTCPQAPLWSSSSSSSSLSSSPSISLSSASITLTTATMLSKAKAIATPSAMSSPFASASATSLPLTSTAATMLNEASTTCLLKMTTTPLLPLPTTPPIVSQENLTRQFIFKLNKTDVRQDASLQEASSLFENFTEQYRNIMGNHEEQLASTAGNGVQRELIFQAAVAFEEFVLRYGFHHLSESKPNISNTNSKLFLRIHRVFHQNASDFHLQDERRQNTIKVPSLNFNSNGSLVVGIQYKDLHELFLTNQLNKDGTEKTRLIDTVIMAAKMYPKPQQLSQNVILKFSNLKALNRKRHCVFWSSVSNSEGWSEEGCHVVRSRSNSEQTECSCNHLTHFAVLLNYGDDFKVTKTDEKVLKILTYVGLALSITGIILTIIPYLLLTDVGQPLSQIRMSLAGSLGSGQIIFLAGIDATDNKVACVTVAALMQYFLTAAFCWMLVEGIYLYLYVVKVYNINNKMTVYHVVSWGFPAVMVAISLSIAAGKGGGIQTFVSDKYCWMSSDNHLIWMFVAFLALIEVLNLLLIARVIKEMATMQLSGENHIQQIWLSIKACVVFIPLLGITWLFGLLAPVHTSFVYISTILNSFQGFLIFLLHCVRNSQIRERFKRKINAIFPAANNGSPAKEKSRVNQSEIDFGVARKIEVKPCNTTAAISVPTAYLN